MILWKKIHKKLQQWASPVGFERLSAHILPWFTPLAWLLFVAGIVWGLAFAPMDYQQKNSFRIIYIHVPAAMLSMSIYLLLAFASLIYFVWRSRIAAYCARAAAPYGALMTAVALITGAIWGKPTWGTFWTWDARLTSELILLFLYLAYLLLQTSIEEHGQADRLSAILAIVGVINIPIIHYSVQWWNSLHQGATLFRANGPSISGDMLWPLILTLLAFYALFATYLLRSIGNLILENRIQRQLEHSL
ncbi:MAG: heme ABC transporter permease CcmC [Cardiobacteriaceae bacterium]|nr:heme ABC transporter permease CcmC [Cardiobacteriaceae bacterium]